MYTSGLLFLGGQEVLIIVLIVLVLFGGKKIPELMRGMGRGIREFKEGQKETPTEEPQNTTSTTTTNEANKPQDN
ncbi:MAG TPA: twin-arginine translocase TatA/TatE family subunit [Candidatus Sphingobacterium stercoripullorum]|uniref:Sec-independent protein translocase protein TatA n=1 Tax=Candidatus Sphingobacterium stercoripullorum TaxID=2838759 RepID=A0A9D1WB59_9SPHI|nr:twin-arginine translocase TatA/TatE family subunit [Candidatus Sphingobacterium stercoripullorum]HLR49503.1 twin-arginine translocase TatA/TatE family subunit [Candidatus Sphingobacterium stercoripullorum]